MPVPTLGLSHVSLAVRDPALSLAFYARAFGVREYFRDDGQIQVLGPGPHDVLAFVRDPANAGKAGGIGHFGFRLAQPDDIDAVLAGALAAGGTLLRRGEFAPGLPFAYVADPDGYEIELWFEPSPRDAAAPAATPPLASASPPPLAPAADAPRKRLDTDVLAYRCLKRLPGYARVVDALADPDDWMGVLVGTYRNPGADGVVVSIQDRGLRWQGGAQRLYAAYDDIVDIDRPGGETTETLTLLLADGQRFSLPVRGRQGRFCDSTAMLRFLHRVRAARAEGGAAQAVTHAAPA
jgi:catechol 2,3-dioxygenase-like lactoylglutathione lyase family enzyme